VATILIVDDDNFLHKVLERILTIAGHRVVGHAYDGAEAVERFRQLNPKPEIILMDHRMPVMSGAAATREILGSSPGVKVLFVSADETVRQEALEAGALGFLTKPIRSADLFAAIDAHI
jgi:two-component system chemotaxis response regulator CheY